MEKIRVATKLCENENDLTFKEKFEIARLLEKLCVSVIEFPRLTDSKEDALLLRTCSSFVKNSILSVEVTDASSVAAATEALVGVKNFALRVEAYLSPVGMEYFHHKKAPKMLEWISEVIAAAKAKSSRVYFCALDATRAEEDVLQAALLAAEKAGANAVYLSDDAGEMLPDEFALFAEKYVKALSIPVGVACSDKSGFALSSAVLAVKKGVRAVRTVTTGDGVNLEALAECVKNSGNRNGVQTDITYTELHRASKQIAQILDSSDKSPLAAAPAFEQKITLDDKDDKEAVIDATVKIGYDLTEEDKDKVYEEFLRVAAKKRVGAKELDAIVASVALQVPAIYKLENYVVNNGNIIRASAQITLTKAGERMQGIMMGDGPIDAAFLCLEQIIGTHYELDDFEIQSVTEGKEAMGSALVKLRKDGKLYSGKGISTDIIGASIRAYLNAVNKIAYEEA